MFTLEISNFRNVVNSPKKLIAITTKNIPSPETYNVPINKRPRTPNKNLQIEQAPDNRKQHSNSITQSEFTSNKGNDLNPTDPSKHCEVFEAPNVTPTQPYWENITKSI